MESQIELAVPLAALILQSVGAEVTYHNIHNILQHANIKGSTEWMVCMERAMKGRTLEDVMDQINAQEAQAYAVPQQPQTEKKEEKEQKEEKEEEPDEEDNWGMMDGVFDMF